MSDDHYELQIHAMGPHGEDPHTVERRDIGFDPAAVSRLFVDKITWAYTQREAISITIYRKYVREPFPMLVRNRPFKAYSFWKPYQASA